MSTVFAVLACLSFGLLAWQWLLAMRFPLHRPLPAGSAAPLVTVLKPLKGADAFTGECLRSWLDQDYAGGVQVLFGVASAADPVCQLVRELIATRSQADAQLLICPEALGLNAKVSTLVQMRPHARGEVVVVSDADVWVRPDMLTQLVGWFSDKRVGLVHCFYSLVNPANLAMRLEAFATNADFWSQVLQAGSIGRVDFALGAVMALPKTVLEQVGGFEPLLDYLADDFQLGHRVAASGLEIALCPIVAQCRVSPLKPSEVWAHQLRWTRTIRVCRPLPFFFSILANSTVWPLAWALVNPVAPVWCAVGFMLLGRMTAGLLIERKLTGRTSAGSFVLGPVSDLLRALLWLLAFAGNTIVWRGQRLRVRRDGKLIARPGAGLPSPASMAVPVA